MSGLDSSPLLADRLGKARGGLETQIGQYLSDQANQRAQYSLTNRLNLDPMSLISPYVQTGMAQGNSQAGLDYDYAQQQAQGAYQQAVDKYNQQNALYKTIGMLSPVGGAIYGGVSGGGGGLAQSLSGSTDMLKSLLPLFMQSGGLESILNSSSSVNPSFNMNSVNPYTTNTSSYNPSNYFSGFSGRGGAV